MSHSSSSPSFRPRDPSGGRPLRSVSAASPPRLDDRSFLRTVVDLVHEAATPDAPALFLIERRPDDFSLGLWPIPPVPSEALAFLVGWQAPSACSIVGLTAPSQVFVAGTQAIGQRNEAGEAGRAGRVTIAVDRADHTRAVVDLPDGSTFRNDHAGGMAADLLARVVGRPTAPPELTPGAWAELLWLDGIAGMVLDRPGEVTWDDLAAHHPRSGGHPADPETLALAMFSFELHTTWSSLRHAWREEVPFHPPGGTIVDDADWFDDGSFSRWMARDLPPRAEVLDAVLINLADDVAALLVQALAAR